VIYNRFYFHIF